MKPKIVFISYKSEDYQRASLVRNRLQEAGVDCWMAPESIQGGMNYASQIPQAIRDCSAFVLLLDKAAMGSKWVSREVDRAINEGKRIFPLILEPMTLTDEFQFYLANVQQYLAYPDFNAALSRMIQELCDYERLPQPSIVQTAKPSRLPLILSLVGGGLAVAALLILLFVLKPFSGSGHSQTDYSELRSETDSASSLPMAEDSAASAELPNATTDVSDAAAEEAAPATTVSEAPAINWGSVNVLMSDGEYTGTEDLDEQYRLAQQQSVFDSAYARSQIRSITFLDSLDDQPADAWDVSALGNGSVMAWVIPNGELYDLFIAAGGGVSSPKNCDYMFMGYSNAYAINLNGHFHTEEVTSMHNMFSYCSKLRSLDFSGCDTAKLTDMSGMFLFDKELYQINLNGFDTSSVSLMNAAFFGCNSLVELDLRSFDTSNVTSMYCLFYDCNNLTSLQFDPILFNTSAVTSMRAMFENCHSLQALDLRSFNTKNVTSMRDMFQNCHSLQALDLRSFNTKNVTTMQSMFSCCEALVDLKLDFDTASVTNMSYMFTFCKKLQKLDLRSFDTSSVTSMHCMFYNCPLLSELQRSDKFVISAGTDTEGMYDYCDKLPASEKIN